MGIPFKRDTVRAGALALAGVLFAGVMGGCGGRTGTPHDITYRYPTEAVEAAPGEWVSAGAPQGMEFIAQKGFVALYADLRTANIAVEDMRNGIVYYSSPPGIAEDSNSQMQSPVVTTDMSVTGGGTQLKNSKEYALDKGGVQVTKTGEGLQVWFKFMEEKYAIPVEYILCEDGIRLRVMCDKIVEQGDTRVYSIALAPFFFAQPGTGDGFMLVPDGSGALLHFSSEKESYAPYTSPLYGDDYLTIPDYVANRTENCALPMIGMQADKGGFLAVTDNGAAYGNVMAYTDGQITEYNNVYFRFDTRRQETAVIGNQESWSSKTVSVFEPGGIGIGDISVRYILLDSTPETGLADMARAARAYAGQTGSGQIAGTAGSSVYISTIGGLRERMSVMGIRVDATVPVTPMSALSEMLDQLETAGVSDAGYLYSGFDKNALRGKLSGRVVFDGKTGSTGELNRLLERLGANRLFLSAGSVVAYKGSGAVSLQTDTIRNISKNRYELRSYHRHTFQPDKDSKTKYLIKAEVAAPLLEGYTGDISKRFPGAGIAVGEFANMLYGDFSRGGNRRGQMESLVGDTLRRLGEGGFAIAQENPGFYAGLYSSVLYNVPFSSGGFDILDDSVPFYQMVFSGARQLVSRPINWYGDAETAFLACVRFGMVPHYEVADVAEGVLKTSGLETFYAAGFDKWSPVIARHMAKYQPLFDKIAGRSIVDYVIYKDGLTATIYDDGSSVYVNSTDEDAMADGRTIPAGSIIY